MSSQNLQVTAGGFLIEFQNLYVIYFALLYTFGNLKIMLYHTELQKLILDDDIR